MKLPSDSTANFICPARARKRPFSPYIHAARRNPCKAKSEEAAAAHAKAIDDYERKLALAAEQAEKDAATIKELQAKLSQASVEAVKASEASAKLSADSAVSALKATKLILARAESLQASREAVADDAKKVASLDGF